jgi:hypothetical protein
VVDGVDPTTLDINKPVMQDAAAMLDKGGELQKTEALCLMYGISPGATTRPATKILDNKSNSPALRRDALQVLLLSLPEPDGRAAAVSAIGDPEMRKVAVPFLALGSQAVSNIRGDIYLNTSSEVVTDYGGINQNDPIIHVKVPNGLDAQPLLGLLSDPDSDMAGYAGYLVALLGDHRGIDPLLKAARTHGFDSDDWTKMVYRAITRLDDDSQTPILEEIYKAIGKNTWQIHEFYWTIRAMHGPNILKLRKKIRDEVGMAQLQ